MRKHAEGIVMVVVIVAVIFGLRLRQKWQDSYLMQVRCPIGDPHMVEILSRQCSDGWCIAEVAGAGFSYLSNHEHVPINKIKFRERHWWRGLR